MKWSKQQLAIPILIGLAIVPFSIREAYTQPPQIAPKREPMPASGDADNREFMELTEAEEKTEVSRKAVLIHDVMPVYPEEAIRDQVEGTVLFEVFD